MARSKQISIFNVFFQAEDGIRDYYASRGLGDVYKRQPKVTVAEGIMSIYLPMHLSAKFEKNRVQTT